MIFQGVMVGIYFFGCAWLTVAWWKCYYHTRAPRALRSGFVGPILALMGVVIIVVSPKISNVLILFFMVWAMIFTALMGKERIPQYRSSRDFILLRRPNNELIDPAKGLHVPYNPADTSIRGNKKFLLGLLVVFSIILALAITLD